MTTQSETRLCDVCGSRMIHQTGTYWYCPYEATLGHMAERAEMLRDTE